MLVKRNTTLNHEIFVSSLDELENMFHATSFRVQEMAKTWCKLYLKWLIVAFLVTSIVQCNEEIHISIIII